MSDHDDGCDSRRCGEQEIGNGAGMRPVEFIGFSSLDSRQPALDVFSGLLRALGRAKQHSPVTRVSIRADAIAGNVFGYCFAAPPTLFGQGREQVLLDGRFDRVSVPDNKQGLRGWM